jgi:TonB-dependent receptor
MGTYTKDKLTVTAGVRYEKTKEKFTRFVDNGSGVVANKEFTGSYDDVLPSVHVRYAFTPDTLVRVSWSNTVARPNPIDIYQVETIDNVNFTIFEPNPALKALNSSNLDASFDWYSGALGQFMVAGFAKQIENFPFNISDNVTIDGNLYDRTTVVGNSDGKITGWEAAFKRKLDFLPGMLGGLGVDLNYCHIDSELQSPIRPDNPNLVGQAEYAYNLGLYYAWKGFFAQIAFNAQGRSIDEYGDTPNFDIMRDPQGIYDFTASYEFGRENHFQVFLEWRNIMNEPGAYHVRGDAPGKGDVLVNRIVSGSSFGGGIRVRF